MTTTKINTLASFCDASHLDSALIRAVVRQFGGWEKFCESAPDVSNHGIDGGFHSFILNYDTETFAKHHRALIAAMASEQANEFGQNLFGMIRAFGCFRDQNLTDEEIGSALYAGRNLKDGANILNALAWYAGEEVCRSYTDLTENA